MKTRTQVRNYLKTTLQNNFPKTLNPYRDDLTGETALPHYLTHPITLPITLPNNLITLTTFKTTDRDDIKGVTLPNRNY